MLAMSARLNAAVDWLRGAERNPELDGLCGTAILPSWDGDPACALRAHARGRFASDRRIRAKSRFTAFSLSLPRALAGVGEPRMRGSSSPTITFLAAAATEIDQRDAGLVWCAR